ncbi:MAG: hypothetical protein VX435_03040 [Planctomycetota bacterium]|nr:hypothetical protein [Planctomycetota bacterium]
MAMMNKTAEQASFFEQLENTLQSDGIPAALDRLESTLREQKEYHLLFDALILKKRYEMELPLVPRGRLTDLPDNLQREFEEHYVEMCRTVGDLYLEEGNIPHAWLYLNTISEPQKVSDAINSISADDVSEEVIDVAFQQGANPKKGYEFILSRYGTCSAITVYEQLSQADDATKSSCAQLLLKQLHGDLIESLRRDIENQEETLPDSHIISELIDGRDWLFGEMSYHVDTSHLSSVVRIGRILKDPEDLQRLLELTHYGRRLSSHFQFPGEEPFEQTYEDYAMWYRTLMGENVDDGVKHFTDKLKEPSEEDAGYNPTAEVVIDLLSRLGKIDQAIEISLKYVEPGNAESSGETDLGALCRKAGNYQGLRDHSEKHGDLVNYAAAMVEQSRIES